MLGHYLIEKQFWWNFDFTEFRIKRNSGKLNLFPAESKNSVKFRRNSVVRNSAGHSTLVFGNTTGLTEPL